LSISLSPERSVRCNAEISDESVSETWKTACNFARCVTGAIAWFRGRSVLLQSFAEVNYLLTFTPSWSTAN
jgi:hypothetical protein